jgi:hypothetical protein
MIRYDCQRCATPLAAGKDGSAPRPWWKTGLSTSAGSISGDRSKGLPSAFFQGDAVDDTVAPADLLTSRFLIVIFSPHVKPFPQFSRKAFKAQERQCLCRFLRLCAGIRWLAGWQVKTLKTIIFYKSR